MSASNPSGGATRPSSGVPSRPNSVTARPSSSHSSASSSGVKSPVVPERTHSVSMSLPKGCSRRDPPPVPPVVVEGDLETREDVLRRELEEARARAAQMEKTMRWWSDCTANWREKWSKARNERNKSREECRHLRCKLESYAKETSHHKKDKGELLEEITVLKKQLEIHRDDSVNQSELTTVSKQSTSEEKKSSVDFVSQVMSRQDKDDVQDFESDLVPKSNDSGQQQKDSVLSDKLLALTLELEEAQKTIQTERKEKQVVHEQVEAMQCELTSMKSQQTELQEARDSVQSKLEKLQHDHRHELGRVAEELEDQFTSRADLDAQIAQLRKQLETLQAENAQEWGKRERLESEKLALERENKKLRVEIANLEEDLQRKSEQAHVLLDGDLKTLQYEMTEKNKELAELKHCCSKLKKAMSDKCGELDHAKSRGEQYEVEVKKLRLRVDELKQELATGEDEVDQQANQIRRLQRTNDELQVQCENLQVQVEHLQTRLRSTNSSVLPPRGTANLKLLDTDGVDVDIPTTDDDNEDV